jgi:tetratricopeptide (TPR) repeat protein
MIKNRALMAVLTILLGLAPLAGHAEDELFDTKAAAQHIEQGIAFLKAKNFDAAIKEFEESAETSPEAEPFYYLGYAYYLKGRAGDGESRRLSRENFEKAYEIDPTFSPVRYKPAQPAPMMQQPQASDSSATPEAAPRTAPPSQPEPSQPNPPADQPKQ